jgi:hypothetical protein
MSARNTVVRATCSKPRPAAFRSAATFRIDWSACAVMSPSTIDPVFGSTGICPETNRRFPARMAGV